MFIIEEVLKLTETKHIGTIDDPIKLLKKTHKLVQTNKITLGCAYIYVFSLLNGQQSTIIACYINTIKSSDKFFVGSSM